jgi:hypothetical protein
MSAAQQKVNLIARVLAETGFKPLFNRLLRLAVRYQDKPRVLRLRGQWTPMDPRQWNANMDYVPNVGLGTGDKQQKRQSVGEVLAAQKEVAAAYPQMVTAKNVYQALKELTKASGLPSVEPYFTDPDSLQQQAAAPPDPMQDPMVAATMAAENIKAQVAMAKAKMDDDFRRDKLEAEIALERMKHEGQLDMAALRFQMDRQREAPAAPQAAATPPPGPGGLPAAASMGAAQMEQPL